MTRDGVGRGLGAALAIGGALALPVLATLALSACGKYGPPERVVRRPAAAEPAEAVEAGDVPPEPPEDEREEEKQP